MEPLNLKLVRDLSGMKGQAIAVALVMAWPGGDDHGPQPYPIAGIGARRLLYQLLFRRHLLRSKASAKRASIAACRDCRCCWRRDTRYGFAHP